MKSINSINTRIEARNKYDSCSNVACTEPEQMSRQIVIRRKGEEWRRPLQGSMSPGMLDLMKAKRAGTKPVAMNIATRTSVKIEKP
jgi:hypothetical protein